MAPAITSNHHLFIHRNDVFPNEYHVFPNEYHVLTPYLSESHSWLAQKRHMLYAGMQDAATAVLQNRCDGNEKGLAKVGRTNFKTSKGELIKSIFYCGQLKIEISFFHINCKNDDTFSK